MISKNENYMSLLKNQVQIEDENNSLLDNDSSTTYEFINFKPKNRS